MAHLHGCPGVGRPGGLGALRAAAPWPWPCPRASSAVRAPVAGRPDSSSSSASLLCAKPHVFCGGTRPGAAGRSLARKPFSSERALLAWLAASPSPLHVLLDYNYSAGRALAVQVRSAPRCCSSHVLQARRKASAGVPGTEQRAVRSAAASAASSSASARPQPRAGRPSRLRRDADRDDEGARVRPAPVPRAQAAAIYERQLSGCGGLERQLKWCRALGQRWAASASSPQLCPSLGGRQHARPPQPQQNSAPCCDTVGKMNNTEQGQKCPQRKVSSSKGKHMWHKQRERVSKMYTPQ
jgi:hypothetical protein